MTENITPRDGQRYRNLQGRLIMPVHYDDEDAFIEVEQFEGEPQTVTPKAGTNRGT